MINKASAWLAANAQGRAVRRRGGRGPAARGAARGRGAADAGDPQAHFGRRAQDRPFHRRAGSARVRQRARPQGPRGARNVVPGSLPAHEDPPARAALRSGGARISTRSSLRSTSSLEAYRADYAAYYERCKRPNSPAMRDPNAVIYSRPRRRHAVLRQGQGDGADRGGVLRQRDQRHARRLERQPIRRARRAGGVRHRILAARGGQAPAHAEAEVARRAASPSSPAAPAASGARSPRG